MRPRSTGLDYSFGQLSRRQRHRRLLKDLRFEEKLESILLACWEPSREQGDEFLTKAKGASLPTLFKLCALSHRHGWHESFLTLKQRLRQREGLPPLFRVFLLERRRDLLEFSEKLEGSSLDPFCDLLLREHLAEALMGFDDVGAAARCLAPLLKSMSPRSELLALLRYRALQNLFLAGIFKVSETMALLDDEAQFFPDRNFLLAARARRLFRQYLAFCLDDGAMLRGQQGKVARTELGLPAGNTFDIVSHQLHSLSYRSLTGRVWRLIGLSDNPSQTERILLKGSYPDLHWYLKAQQRIATLEKLQQADDRPALENLIEAAKEQECYLWMRRAIAQKFILLLAHQPESFLELWPSLKAEVLMSASPGAQTASALFEAAYYYRRGDFEGAVQQIRRAQAQALSPLQFAVMDLWLSVAQGQSSHSRQNAVIVLANRLGCLLFAPELRVLEAAVYRISPHFQVHLNEHRVLQRLLQALLHTRTYSMEVTELQLVVWRQGTSLQGWKQKIRNTISRLRYEFRQTLIPLFLQEDGVLSLNAQGVHIAVPSLSLYMERRMELLRMLGREPASTQGLVEGSKIPLATVKRILKQLLEEGLIVRQSEGRLPRYSLSGKELITSD